MKWHPGNSSQIEAYAYDPQAQELHMRFYVKPGKPQPTYVYKGVGPERFADFHVAPSKGSHHHVHIKGSYEFEKRMPEEGATL